MAHGGSVVSKTAELFPIPAPFPWQVTEFHEGSRRKRARWKRRRALELLVNIQVAALNFVYNSRGDWFYGIPLNTSQREVVDNLWARACSLSRLGHVQISGCGSSRLDHVSTELDLLHACFSSVDVPYGIHSWTSTKRMDPGTTTAVPLVAEKVAFPDNLLGFDPLPFLDDTMARAYHSPSQLLGHEIDGKVAAMPPDCVGRETRGELHHLGLRWDKTARLCLALPEEISQVDRCNLFCVSKPDGELRQIIDRRPRNARELPPPRNGPKMGHALFWELLSPKVMIFWAT